MKRPQGLFIRRTCFFFASEPDSLRWIPVRVGIRVGKRNIQIETSCHVGAKFALLRRSFIPVEQKSVIRPLPCSSFPTAIRCAGLAVGSGNGHFMKQGIYCVFARRRALILLLLAFGRDPQRSRWRLCRLTDAACPLRVLRWVVIWLRNENIQIGAT